MTRQRSNRNEEEDKVTYWPATEHTSVCKIKMRGHAVYSSLKNAQDPARLTVPKVEQIGSLLKVRVKKVVDASCCPTIRRGSAGGHGHMMPPVRGDIQHISLPDLSWKETLHDRPNALYVRCVLCALCAQHTSHVSLCTSAKRGCAVKFGARSRTGEKGWCEGGAVIGSSANLLREVQLWTPMHGELSG